MKARSTVQGMKDNIPNESFIEWEQEMPETQIARFYHSGHMPMAEEPDLFFKTIREFLSGYSPTMKGI